MRSVADRSSQYSPLADDLVVRFATQIDTARRMTPSTNANDSVPIRPTQPGCAPPPAGCHATLRRQGRECHDWPSLPERGASAPSERPTGWHFDQDRDRRSPQNCLRTDEPRARPRPICVAMLGHDIRVVCKGCSGALATARFPWNQHTTHLILLFAIWIA